MSHDPLCKSRSVDGFPCYTCALIARVLADERALVAVERTTLAELNAEYRKGVQAARDAVAAVEEEYVGDYYKQGSLALRVALAAIDALRGDTASRISSGYDPAATENRP